MKETKKVGRPKKKINYETVQNLASIMATQEEIAKFLDVSVRTLQRNKEFCRIYKKGLETGKMSLRRKQFKLAESNPAMAIFLGKNYLNQSDRRDIDMTIFPSTIVLVEEKKQRKEEEPEEEGSEKEIIDVSEME